MKVKRWITSAVFFMAVASLAGPIFAIEGDLPKPSPELIVYYFHGHQRCWTCRRIEELANSALVEKYADELQNGRIQWQVVNFETEGNEHFIEDFNLFSKAVIIQRFQEGKEADWKNLQKIWELVGDEKDFLKYVQDEVGAMLGNVQ